MIEVADNLAISGEEAEGWSVLWMKGGHDFCAPLKWVRSELAAGRKVLLVSEDRALACGMALLVMAKVFGELPDNFDEAWDGFAEKMMLREEPLLDYFQPSLELEDWLRENWDGLKVEPLMAKPVPPPPVAEPGVETFTEKEAIALGGASPLFHFSFFSQIKMKDGVVRTPLPNKMQDLMFDAYQWLQERGLPIRLCVLKPRQSGGTEGSVELVYHHCRRFNLSALLMADQHKRTDKVWDLFCAKSQFDSYEAFWGNTFRATSEKAEIVWKDENGRTQKALIERDTALDPKAGASGTRHVILFSESARYAKDGKFRDTEVIGNALSSIPPEMPNTMAIMESTGEGTGGAHHDTFQGAVTLAERKKGKVGNGWIKIFVAWQECEDYRLVENDANREYFDDEDPRWVQHQEEEAAGEIRYKWTKAQIAWRRKKIEGECGGDIGLFHRDFPSSSEECWASSGSKRFNVVAVARMLKHAQWLWEQTLRGYNLAPQLGSLVPSATGQVFLGTREDDWLWVAEKPEYGRAYALIVDPMTGEQARGCQTPDNHACGVIRREYVDKQGVLHQAELVAVIHVPGGCRWDIDILADRLWSLACWYGKCIIIPEVNKAMDLIPPLRGFGANLYMRPARPDAENFSERQKVVGFLSSESTRRLWVSAAAEAVREGSIICRYLPAVKELDTFITNGAGRAEAAQGEHDDWVSMLGIGKLCLAAATLMRPPADAGHRNYGQTQEISRYAKGAGALG